MRRIARPMLAAVFVVGGFDALRHPAAPRRTAAAPLVKVSPARSTCPTTRSCSSAPTAPRCSARGALLATGRVPRARLARSSPRPLVPTTVAGHAFWEETDPAKRARSRRSQFLKNVGLLGGLLLAAVDTAGKPGLRGGPSAPPRTPARGRTSQREAKQAARLASRGPPRGSPGGTARHDAHHLTPVPTGRP